MDENENENLDEEELKKQEEDEANSKTAHVVGKAAATYFGGAAGNAAYNLADKLGVAKPIEDLAGKAIKTTPALNQASKMLNKVGALDAADKAIDMAGGQAGGAANGAANATGELAKEGLAKETLSKEGLEKAEKVANAKQQAKAKSKSKSSGSGESTTEKEKKKPIWLFVIIGIIVFLPFILILLIAIVAFISFLVPGLGVINFFSGILDFFNSDVLLQAAEEDYYEHLEEAQNNAFQDYNVCIDVNLIHATLTVEKFGDTTLDEGEELCEDLESCNDESKDVLTVSDYRKMEKYIDILANMQIKRKKYALYTTACYTSSYGDRCAEGKEDAKTEKVTVDNLECAEIGWLDSIDLSWNGIPF